MNAARFTKNPKRITIVQPCDGYYTFTKPDGDTVGSRSRASLERYVRELGFTPDFRDDRPKKQSTVWDAHNHRT